MSYAFSPMDHGLLWLRYTGAVAYTERQEALLEAVRRLNACAGTGLLVDFSDAAPYEEAAGARVDYISAAIAVQWPKDVRIAVLSAAREFAEPTKLAAHVRQLDAKTFEDRGAALAWLAQAGNDSA